MSYLDIESICNDLHQIRYIQAMLDWDRATYMPPKSQPSRADALAYLARLEHEILTNPSLLSKAEHVLDTPLDLWQQRNVLLFKKKLQRIQAVPKKLFEDKVKLQSTTQHVWQELKPTSNWDAFRPHLEKLVAIIKEEAHMLSDTLNKSPYDVLLDEFSPGLTQAYVDPLFNELESSLPSLIQTAEHKQEPSFAFQAEFPMAAQKACAKDIMDWFNFNFQAGRLDESVHPFTQGGKGDVRITTHYDVKNPVLGLLAICHETGHALYENCLPEKWRTQLVGQSMGMTIHESQSLFVEMQISKSLAFMEAIKPILDIHYPAIVDYTPSDLFQLINHVQRSHIRIYADELTYPMHIVLRYEIEKMLFTDEVEVKDLPAIWEEKLQNYLGLTIGKEHNKGLMQDIHWSSGAFGYFPAYTLGAIYAANLREVVDTEININNCIQASEFKKILDKLTYHVHQYGSLYDTTDLIKQSLNKPLDVHVYINYLTKKFT